uniref:Ubiquitin-like protease family profile domain-containing protein n=1 Tax=Megaselia scalaris TaxID=36166 RepID=T1GDP9_MEGSC
MSSESQRHHPDPYALSFNDSLLRVSDVQLLKGPHWLNDQIISFYFEYLQKCKFKTNSDISFVSPEVTQCMKLMDDSELEMMFQDNEFHKKSFLFFALNDNDSYRAGGTHWSLAVLSRPERAFFHFDSCNNQNFSHCQQFVKRIKDTLNCSRYLVKSVRCLQQLNGYDCGIHVLSMAEHIGDYVNRFECIDGFEGLHLDHVSRKRGEILKIIQILGGKV